MSWRLTNLILTCAWLLMIPLALGAGWLSSVVFVSAISLYANVASHLAAWRADVIDKEVVDRVALRVVEVLREQDCLVSADGAV